MSTVTKPIVLDETLQSTNTALSSLGKDTTLQAIATAIANVGLSNIGNMSSLATTDKTSLVSAINEVVGDVSDLDTDKADKVTSATSGNLAGLNASGNLTDSGWASDKTTTSASGNPISITGLKSNQLAKDPIITFEPIQAGSGDPSPSNVRAISGYDKIDVLSCGKNICDGGYSESGKYLNQDGTLTNGSSWYVTNYIPVKSEISYTLSHSSSVSNNGICWYDKNKAYINGALWGSANTKTITLPSNAKYIRASYYYNWVSTFQIEEGQTPTTYEPYHKTTDLSEPLPQTVYGGTLDVRTGKLSSNMIMINLKGKTADTYATTGVIIRNVFDTSLFRAEGISSHAHVRTWKDPTFESGKMMFGAGDAHLYWSDILTIMNKTIAEFNTWLANEDVWVCYDAGTGNYTEIQLTPHEISLLKDYAYVSTNGTSIALDYHNGEIATLGDVAQVGETVNLIGEKVEFEDVSQYFTKDDTNINSANISAYRIGKMVFISGSLTPNTLSSLQNKSLVNITNDKILPLSGNIYASGIYVPIITQSGTSYPILLSINKLNKRIKTDNCGAYGAITNITTNSFITFSASYVCQG